jgi:ABC-2 type transport system permease protein
MLRKLYAIIRTEFLMEFAYPMSLVFFLVLPLVFTAAVGAGLGGLMDGEEEAPQTVAATLYVVDLDQGSLTETLLQNLEQIQLDPVLVDVLPEDQFGLEIPAGFSEALARGESVSVTLHTLPTTSASQAVEQYVNAAVSRLGGAVMVAEMGVTQAQNQGGFNRPAAEAAYFDQLLEDTLAASETPLVTSELSWAGEAVVAPTRDMATSAEQASAGQIVTWTQITLLAAAEVFVNEREGGTLKRLLISPSRRFVTIGGKMLSRLLLGLLQMTVLFVGGALIFGVQWGKDPLALILVSFTFALATTSLGMLIATFVRTRSQASSVVVGLAMGLSALGGAWYPMEITPMIYRQIVKVFPSTWAMQAYTDLLVRQAGLAEVLPVAGVLLGFAAVFMLLAMLRFGKLEGINQ